MISDGCRDLNLGAVAILMVILALSFEAWLGRAMEETADFLRAGISFNSIGRDYVQGGLG